MLAEITYQINNFKSSPAYKDSPNPPEPANVVPTNSRAPTLDSGKSTKNLVCGLLNMRSVHQYSMNSSSIQNSKETLLWTLITSTTTSICV